MTEKLLCKRNLSIENNDHTLCCTKTDKNFYFWQVFNPCNDACEDFNGVKDLSVSNDSHKTSI